ncbi:hypothetical protein MMA64_16740 [Salmonella enterica]|nr:hypothetical protein [Salmonella enterica]MCL8674986.1 hypothetical protein [Salmonella enterica subsp. enterica serovar Enteritidis]MDG0164999.1 hypothetical protein [Salmonella enterica subsp. enterica]MCH5793375.1 hypothetical protein [Salmonella enterica]MCH5798545.1 hypothetical protein [Salmonella enterica]MCH5808257.1 hypothetical protein [Salmonella enterica]
MGVAPEKIWPSGYS